MRHLDLQALLMLVPLFILSITLHEWGHAILADRLGDPTPRAAGRVTLNPLVHLDLMGSLFLVIAGFGWAKPVPVMPHNFERPRLGSLLVSLAGPGMNFLLAVSAVLVLKHVPSLDAHWVPLLQTAFGLNLMLAIFNLLPMPPLDGGHILEAVLPRRWLPAYRQLTPFGTVALFVIFMLPGGLQPLGLVQDAVATAMVDFL